MIGRGCLKNPFIFMESFQLWRGEAHLREAEERNYLAVLERLGGHLETFYDEKRLLIQLKKFASWYSAGFPESASFRKRLFTLVGDRSELWNVIQEYFTNLSGASRKDTSSEAFLMGGHG